jgi:hypothetical protein
MRVFLRGNAQISPRPTADLLEFYRAGVLPKNARIFGKGCCALVFCLHAGIFAGSLRGSL